MPDPRARVLPLQTRPGADITRTTRARDDHYEEEKRCPTLSSS
jgi:hypothetical protein